jgi:ABC-2 type transport system ATP-binding protein
MYGRYNARRRPAAGLLELVELDARRDARVKSLSGGQRRRLDLALALVGDPGLVFLDEPTTGFDPAARRHAWSTIRSLCALGKTVFLTTHFMDEAQTLADRVAVMRAGEIIASGPPAELGGRDLRPTEIRFVLPDGWSVSDLPELPAVLVGDDGERVLVRSADGVLATKRITAWALEHDVELAQFSVTQPTLEDVYLALTDPDSASEPTALETELAGARMALEAPRSSARSRIRRPRWIPTSRRSPPGRCARARPT